jgi:hypothetical protein
MLPLIFRLSFADSRKVHLVSLYRFTSLWIPLPALLAWMGVGQLSHGLYAMHVIRVLEEAHMHHSRNHDICSTISHGLHLSPDAYQWYLDSQNVLAEHLDTAPFHCRQALHHESSIHHHYFPFDP